MAATRISDGATITPVGTEFVPLGNGVGKVKASTLAIANLAIQSFSTTGNSGVSTYSGNILNIPNYTLAGLGGTTLAAVNAQNLSVFASTTSAQLAGVISDETGSGALVFANSPTLVTPNLGTVATGLWQGTKIALTYGGTNADLSATGGASQFLRQSTVGGNISVSIIATGDLPNLVANTQTTSYTLVLGDAANLVETNSATPVNITVPPNSSVAFPIGTQIIISQYGAGLNSIVAGGGVTIRSFAGNLAGAGQYTAMYLEKRGTDEWYLWNGPSVASGALTKTDDTNVTLTLGGTPTTALLQATSLTLGWNGTLAGTRGGTGIGSNSTGDLIYGSGTNTWAAKNVFNTTQTALLHFKAGTASASTAPQKYTVGTIMSTVETGAVEYDNAQYLSNAALNRYGAGGSIIDFYTDIGNSGSAETDLYTYTTKASTLSQSGEKLVFVVTGTVVGSATASRDIKVYFAGTVIGSISAATISTTGGFKAVAEVIRTGSTTARASVTFTVDNLTVNAPVTETDLTSLTLSGTNIIKITGKSSGTGSATNDVVAKMGWVNWFPAANNP